MEGIEQRNADIEQPTTSATDMNKQPFVIGFFFMTSHLCIHKITFLSICVMEVNLGTSCIHFIFLLDDI